MNCAVPRPNAVSQYIGVPTITNCGALRTIAERSATGTFIGPAFNALNPNVGTSITWAFVSPPNGLPISIGLCDGQLRVITPFAWTAAQSYAVTVQVRLVSLALRYCSFVQSSMLYHGIHNAGYERRVCTGPLQGVLYSLFRNCLRVASA